MGLQQRAETLKRLKPNLVVDLYLYSTEDGGRTQPIPPGWACPCFADREQTANGWDGSPMLGDEWMHPGETRRVGYFFLSGEDAAAALSKKYRFYLWENRIIGEAEIIPQG